MDEFIDQHGNIIPFHDSCADCEEQFPEDGEEKGWRIEYSEEDEDSNHYPHFYCYCPECIAWSEKEKVERARRQLQFVRQETTMRKILRYIKRICIKSETSY